MTKLIGSQLSLIAESEFEERSVGDWDYDDWGSDLLPIPRKLLPNISYGLPPVSTPGHRLPVAGQIGIRSRPDRKLGTDKSPVPNSLDSKLGTQASPVPNFLTAKLGTQASPVPNFLDPKLGTDNWTPPSLCNWKPPVGGLDRKWIKDHQYWCWRYYDNTGKKRSIHLHKDYNKAVRKAMKIGTPPDAKLPTATCAKTDPQNLTHPADNLIDLAQTAHGASRNPIAA